MPNKPARALALFGARQAEPGPKLPHVGEDVQPKGNWRACCMPGKQALQWPGRPRSSSRTGRPEFPGVRSPGNASPSLRWLCALICESHDFSKHRNEWGGIEGGGMGCAGSMLIQGAYVDFVIPPSGLLLRRFRPPPRLDTAKAKTLISV
ncbi:uncharacterized protein VTP21DRAFT_698 [Calcarisporiella thermophila]|uniref:uncharacterized protein n=1 Tax=Calcarisporiella thermophila TaxID=911321 RepID=UPI003742C5F4